MSLDVADLVATLSLNQSNFVAGMAAAEGRAKSGANNIKVAFGAIGIAAAAVIVDMTKKAADFQSMTQTLANNTNMGARGLDQMRAGVLKLAQQTGQPLESLSQGWMHIANHAYDGAAAMNIAAAAAKNAAATGGDAGNDMNVLAGVMREYGVSAHDAATNTQLATRYMDVLHNAVANSNFTMNDFVEGSKRAIATAGNFGVPLSQVSAQLAVLSEHGFPTAHVAALNWAGMLRSLEKPTSKALDGMVALSKRTGIDLVGDIKRLQRDGAFLPKFIDDIRKATGGNFNDIRSIMTQSSYATALMALVKAHGQLADVQAKTNAAQNGQMLPGMTGTNEAFLAWSKTVNGQLVIMRGTFDVLAVRIGSVFLPILNNFLTAMAPIVSKIADWISHNTKLVAILLGAVAVVGSLAGGAAALSLALGPIVGLVGAITVPMLGLVGAVALLATAWAGDWGGIREITAQAWRAMQPAFKAIGAAVNNIVHAFRMGGMSAAATVALSEAGKLLAHLGSWIWNTALPAIANLLKGWAAAFWQWVQHIVPLLLSELGKVKDRLLGWIGTTVLPAIASKLGEWAGAFWRWVQPVIPKLLPALTTLKDRLLGWVKDTALPAIAAKLGEWATAFWKWVEKSIPPLIVKLGYLYGKLVGWIISQEITLGQKLAGWIAQFVQWAQKIWPQLLPKLLPLLQQLGTWITTNAGPTISKFAVKLGNALMDGFMDGIKAKLPDLQGTVTFVANALPPWMKGPLGIKSPSTVFHKIGENMMEGLKEGIMAGASGVSDVINKNTEHWVRAHHVAAHMVRAHMVAGHMVAAHLARNAGHHAAGSAMAYTAAGQPGVLGSGGSNLPVAYNYNPATGTSGAAGPAALASSLPGMANYGGGGGVTINVMVAPGAVTVRGGDASGMGQRVGNTVAQALDALAQSQLLTSPGAGSLLPGAM